MEKDVESKLKIQDDSANHGVTDAPKPKSFKFRAPQENFTIQDFEMGKIYGVGSYSKVVRAMKKDTGKVYALKIMDKKFITHIHYTWLLSPVKVENFLIKLPGGLRNPVQRKPVYGSAEQFIFSANVKPMQDSQITVLQMQHQMKRPARLWGTAAYIPPEVLNSSHATIGNDLWALGCTLFQMLSGTSPFKDASEYLIFQKIISRDVKFPDYFSNDARDLIDKLLVSRKQIYNLCLYYKLCNPFKHEFYIFPLSIV
ncbi:hypothetical protein R6Q57_019637, partial [Mikania cordata]